jgi:MFS family permease
MSSKSKKSFTILKPNLKGLSRDSYLLALSSFFADISTEMLYPILPIFLIETLGATGSIVGLVDGVAQATQNLVQGYSGWLSDRLRKRKNIALVGYVLAALSKPLIGFAHSWEIVLGARFFDRVGTGIRSAPRDALVAASVARADRGKAFGIEGIGDNLGAFVGPLVSIFLFLYLALDIHNIFFLSVIPGFLAVFMTYLVREKSDSAQAESKLTINFSSLPKKYWKYLVVIAIFGLGNSSNAFLILHTKSLGISLVNTILIYAGFNLVAALISYPAGALSDFLGRKTLLLIAFAIFCVTYLGFALSTNTFLIAGLFVLYGLFHGINRSVGKALASDLVPEHLHAVGIGWYNGTVGLLGLIASIAGGVLWDHVGPQSVFVFGAATAACGFVALLLFTPGTRK